MNRQHGFTLAEVLVAFAILAMALPALLQLGGAHLRGKHKAERLAAAAELAESLLASAGDGAVLAEGERSGATDDKVFAWTLTIVKADDLGFEARLVEPYRVTVTVRAKGVGRPVTLTTVRLKPRGGAP